MSPPPAPASASEAPTPYRLPARPDRPVARVTVGVIGTTSDVIFYLAEEKGYFEHMRIEPVFERFDSGGRMTASLATGQIDVGGGTPSVGLYNSIARGVNIKMVADRASSTEGHDTWNFVARKDLLDSGALRDWADLRGRKIALAARGITSEVLIGLAGERGGFTLNDVEIVELSYPDTVVALGTKAIDLGITPEPYPSIAEQRGVGAKWRGNQELAPNQVASVIMYGAPFFEQRPDIARDFMVVYLLGARHYNDAFMKQQPQALAEARDTLARRTELKDPDLLQRIQPGYIDPNGRLDRAALRRDYEWFREHAGLNAELDLDQIIDSSFADYAVSLLGEYR
ncbi:MAG: ABC transporter substrate-binding protein [Chloroflexi bacterium]|nr:ABC transporter substrate-binding protein [Chloroflexota bacterium]